MILTKEFDVNVYCQSDTARRLKIDNTPTAQIESNLRDLHEGLLLPLMLSLPGYFNVTSGFRCDKLNATLKGKPHSQHITGMAADVEYVESGVEMNDVLIDKVKESGIDFDQCIAEGIDKKTGRPRWVHLSYNKGNNRKQFLTIP